MKSIGGWLFAGILLAIIIYLQLCGTRIASESNNDAIVKALTKSTEDTVKYYEELLKADSSAIETAIAHAELSSGKQQQAEADLQESLNRESNLITKLRAARKEKPKDDWLSVSPRYVNACDSLEVVAEDQKIKIGRYTVTTKELEKAVLAGKAEYDKKIQHQKDFNSALKFQLDTCQSLLAKTNGERKTQVYIGGNLLGNKQTIISGGMLTVTMLTKKDNMFEVNGALINGEAYVGAGTKVLISFRKKRRT